MEIKRVGENKIRCALTEDEIREMGFDIDEIIGNGEATQKFMRVVLKSWRNRRISALKIFLRW